MVDSVLLLVDAVDGPMPQTRFVTQKAFEQGLNPIVVINKIDRPEARPFWVLDQVFELFDRLGASDHQLDFPVIYASALQGISSLDPDQMEDNMDSLLDIIIVLTGDPDPMPLIYLFFSLWGLAQLLFCLICWIVVFRYKELISLMYILFISEWLVRLVFYPLIGLGLANNEIYSNGSTPGSYLAPEEVIFLFRKSDRQQISEAE